MPFLDNSIRRAPINMEDIPIPNQGMPSGAGIQWPGIRPKMSMSNAEIEALTQELKRSDNQEPTQRTLELRRRIDEAMSQRYPHSQTQQDKYQNILRQQRDIQSEIPSMSMADFLNSDTGNSDTGSSDIQFK